MLANPFFKAKDDTAFYPRTLAATNVSFIEVEVCTREIVNIELISRYLKVLGIIQEILPDLLICELIQVVGRLSLLPVSASWCVVDIMHISWSTTDHQVNLFPILQRVCL